MSALAYRHQRAQRLRRLLGRRSAREDEGRFVIEGVNLLEEALDAGVLVEAVYLDSAWARSAEKTGGQEPGARQSGARQSGVQQSGVRQTGAHGRLGHLIDRSFALGVRVFELEAGVMARIADTVTPQPVMAIVETPKWALADLKANPPQLAVVCVEVRDPGNAGTLVRSARAAGADAVVFCEGSVDPWNPKAVRSSAGAVLHVPVVTAGAPTAVLDEIGAWGLRRLGAVRDGGTDYAAVDLTAPCALVFGNEAAGLPLDVLDEHIDGSISIPMPGGAESLNVGMAAAVLCFEVARQRRYGPPIGLAGQIVRRGGAPAGKLAGQ